MLILTFIKNKIPHSIVNTFRHLPTALTAAAYYGFPHRKLKIIGVTGSDGKTTTVTGVHHILRTANKRASMISTVQAVIGKHTQDTGFHVTTPDPWLMQPLLKQMVARRTKYAVLETTSHGLAQHRLAGIHFDIGIITNVTHEHLDYHQTYDRYLMAKAKLFRRVKVAILNRDDASYGVLRKYLKTKNPKAMVLTYGMSEKDVNFQGVNIESMANGTSFICEARIDKKISRYPVRFQIRMPLIGSYNVYNALAMIAVAAVLKIPYQIVKKALETFPQIPGRMEVIKIKKITIIVDFAHTPNAVANALKTLREHFLKGKNSKSKLIVVFGSAGLRDVTKRPLMGKAAAENADVIVLTAEDPRTEDVNKIIEQIAKGCVETGAKEIKNSKSKVQSSKNPTFIRVPDRQAAINLAIQKLAKPGDVVAILGKGHEQSMCFGTTETPWSDREAVEMALKS